jgi:hypothetical protein
MPTPHRSNEILQYDYHDRTNVHHTASSGVLSARNRRDAVHERSHRNVLE